MGPPISPPKVLMWEDWRGTPLRLLLNVLASRWVFCRNSKTDPWKSLVPFLVTMLTTAPVVQPYCASKLVVWILNSPVASAVGTYETDCASRRLVTPSTSTSFMLGRPPLTVMLDDPEMSNGRSRCAAAFSTTPGADQAWANGLRPCSGVSSTRLVSTVRPRSADSVS